MLCTLQLLFIKILNLIKIKSMQNVKTMLPFSKIVLSNYNATTRAMAKLMGFVTHIVKKNRAA